MVFGSKYREINKLSLCIFRASREQIALRQEADIAFIDSAAIAQCSWYANAEGAYFAKIKRNQRNSVKSMVNSVKIFQYMSLLS
jgi:hypothetical protein